MVISIIVLGFVAIALQIKNDERFIQFFNLLVFAATAQLLISNFSEDSSSAIYALIGLTSLNFLASQIKFLQKEYIRVLVPLLSVVGYLFAFSGQTISFLGEDYLSVNKFLVGGSLIAVLGYEFGLMKIKLLRKLLDGVGDEDVMTALLLFFTGIAVLLGNLASSSFGVLVVTAAFLSSSFYRKEGTNRLFISLLILTLPPLLLSLMEGETAVLVDGDVIGGLFIGAFGMYFIQQLWFSKKRNAMAIFVAYFLVIGIAFGLLWVGSIFYKMGGMDAMISVLIGVSLINAVFGRGYIAASLFAFLMAGATMMPSYLVNEEQNSFENKMIIDQERVGKDGNVIKAPSHLPIEELSGSYSLLTDSSFVQFELGEGGKTKGAFKKVLGSVVIDADLAKSVVDITLPMEHFTTFIASRDKSLMSNEYFNVSKFPLIKYKANGIVKTSDNSYQLQGDFTMLGVTKKVEVSFHRINIDNREILIGSGEIDRTIFGMTPDASEGNVVSFSYQVELK